ncbi:MAG: M56 family metallopeptidase [Winogradskyella sp.]|uniref:M56 family metallopeptidase n=1 Tax=Winogradskyella sp. TaxID=1883156 RepID=UPI00385DD114
MEYLLKASVVIALFYLCFFLLLKKETFFQHNRWFLLAGLVVALIFPLIVIPVYIPMETVAIQNTDFIPTLASDVVVAQSETNFDWTRLIPIIYGIGCVLFLIQFILQFGSLALLLLKNPKLRDEQFTYVIIKNDMSPFSFFKWIVYNPKLYEDDELELILTHEKVHVNQWHSIDIIFTQLACVLFWFNPLIWLYRKEVRQNLEYIADSETQIATASKKAYQHLLLKTSVSNHDLSLSNHFYNSSIKKRILMMNKSRSHNTKQLKYLFILPLVAVLLISMNTEEVYVETETVNGTSSNQDKVISIITKDTKDSEFEAIIKEFEEKNATLSVLNLERNKQNEITHINLKLSGSTYESHSDTAIKTFLIYKEFFEENGSFIGREENGALHLDQIIGEPELSDTKAAFITRVNALLSKYNLSDQLNPFSFVMEESVKVTFTKNMTDGRLDEMKSYLKAKDVTMTVNRIKRNNNGDISQINIDFETEHGSTNYNVKNTKGIKSFYFEMNSDGRFGVSAIKDVTEVIEDEINTTGENTNIGTIHLHNNGDDLKIEVDTDTNQRQQYYL